MENKELLLHEGVLMVHKYSTQKADVYEYFYLAKDYIISVDVYVGSYKSFINTVKIYTADLLLIGKISGIQGHSFNETNVSKFVTDIITKISMDKDYGMVLAENILKQMYVPLTNILPYMVSKIAKIYNNTYTN